MDEGEVFGRGGEESGGEVLVEEREEGGVEGGCVGCRVVEHVKKKYYNVGGGKFMGKIFRRQGWGERETGREERNRLDFFFGDWWRGKGN